MMKTKPEGLSPQEWEDFLAEELYYKRLEAKQEEQKERKFARRDFDFERDCGAAY
jgi:hypothetical protein